jgi:hypothetical protein
MTAFETEFFQPLKFAPEQLSRYLGSAERDLDISANTDIPEVRFKFAYEALIKLGIYIIAKQDYKVRSRSGHHIKIIEKLSDLISEQDVAIIGNKMRQERNLDLYDGGAVITDTDSRQYLGFIKELFEKYGV